MSYHRICRPLLAISFSLICFTAFTQPDCIDLGTGIGVSNDEIALIDFFKNGGTWEVVGQNNHPWYKVNRLDSFKVVNGGYYNWDIDWSGTVNNSAWGANWADCFISFWDMMVDQGKIRPDGYPVEFPTTVYKYRPKSANPNQPADPSSPVGITSFSRRIYFPSGLPQQGWVLKWKGRGRISYQGIEVAGANVPYTDHGESWKPDNSAPYAGRDYSFDSRPTGNGRVECSQFWMVHGYVLSILESDPADPIRDIVMLYPGLEAQFDAGSRFNPLFLERMQQFRSLRYMGYLNSNGILSRRVMANGHPFENTDMLARLRWNERTPENYYAINNGNGGNYETIIELSNLTHTNPWVNIPYCAGKPYVDSLVALFMNGLDPDLTLYLEVGNEMWNYAQGFDGYFWQARLRVREYPGLGDVEARGVFINDLFQQVTETAGPGNLPRIVRVYGAFPRYYDINNRTVSMIDPNNWDALASTWYFSLSNSNNSSNECRDSQSGTNWRSVLYNWFQAHPNDQAGFNNMYRDCMLNEFRCQGGYRNNTDVVLANYYNKRIICYEGGNHTFYGCENGPTGQALSGELDFNTPVYPDYYTDNAFINRVCVADESDAMGEVFNEVLDSLQSAGFELANHLSFAGRSTCYGVWDLIQDRDITEPLGTLLARYSKFRVFSERISSSSCWQQQIILEGDTVGAGLSIMTDGINDYIDAGTGYIPDETSNYTLEAWFKTTLSDTNQVVLSFSAAGADNNYNVVKIRKDNRLVWETGNNGSVYSKLTGPVIEADLWNHVALVKNGVRYTLYLNGMKVADNSFNLSQAHRDRFTIAALYSGGNSSSHFRGEIDEVRLWNAARTVDEIRDFMCKKVPRNYARFSSLTAYYRFDYPDYTGSGLYDYVSRSIQGYLRNITITERSRYAISGAAIGDYSRYIYPASWSGASVSVTHPQGDRLSVYNVANGSPSGIQVYMYDGTPHYNNIPQYYDDIADERIVGVFLANGTASSYDVTYTYPRNPDAYTSGGESDIRLLRRNDASVEDWLHAGAVPDLVAHSLTVSCKETYRAEYNIGHRHSVSPVRPGSGRALLDTQTPTGSVMGLVQYLNLSNFTATFWAKGWGEVFNLTSKLKANSCNFTLGVDGSNTYCGVRYGRHWDYDVTINGGTPIGNVNEWHHYAITKNGSTITIYVDGMERASGNVTVNFPIQELYFCNAPAWQSGNFPGGRANLSLDEFALWNVALDQTTIREWMCKKINAGHPYQCKNLVVYFNFDEGSGAVLEDRRGPSDAVFTTDAQGFQWIASGAAIGDESLSNYVSPANISFYHPDGDYLEAVRTSGTSNGIHLYRVDHMPPDPSTTNSTTIRSVDSTRYWGLYVAKAASATPQYSIVNHYQYNSQVNISRESELRMPSRTDNSVAPWDANVSILPNTASHTLTLPGQLRGEYILAGTSAQTFNDYIEPEQPVFVSENDTTNISTICGNSNGLVYRVEHDPYATNYVWNLPDELSGFSSADSIVVNAGYNGTSPVDVAISVVAVNAYGQSDTAFYTVHILPQPTVADAGPDQFILPPLFSTTMDGNAPLPLETAIWELTHGTGTLADAHDPKTGVTNMQAGSNYFSWNIDNGVCPFSTDTVILLVAPPPVNIIQQNGHPLPVIVCGGEVLQIRAVPHEDIIPDSYVWQMPEGITLVSQNGSDAVILVGSGIGGSIQIQAVYSGHNSEPYSSNPLSINSLPGKPEFEEAPAVLCLEVSANVSLRSDALVDSVVWTLPYGIYPTTYPRSTSGSIEVQAIDITMGYIVAHVYNDGCSGSMSADSFMVSVSRAPEKPELALGTDGGTADAVCANSDFVLWVNNNDPQMNYEWEWDANLTFVDYLTANHSAALFHITDQNSTVRVRTYDPNNGTCARSEWFEFYAWPQNHGPASITAINITNPTGQNPMNLVAGQTYTFTVTGDATTYYWNIPAGFELIDDGDLNDEENLIRVVTAGAGFLDVYPVTERGCTGDVFSVGIGTTGSLLPPAFVSGNTEFCQGTSPNITVSQVAGATQYIWTLPDGTVISTASNVLNQVIHTPMEGVMTVVAQNGSLRSTPLEIRIQVSSSSPGDLVFVDEDMQTLRQIEICDGDSYKPIYILNNLASSHIWEIHGSALQFEPRWEPGHDGQSNYELRNRTSPVDTMMPVSWVNWRCKNDGADGGYIVVTSVNVCGGASIKDSIPYVWHQTLSELIPEFITAPLQVCVGSMVNYEIKPVNGASSYLWQLPNGLTVDGLITNTPSITVNVVNGTGGPVRVLARGEYCGSSQTAEQVSGNVSISGENVDFHFIEEPLAACPGDMLTYSVNDIGTGTYSWSLPEALRSTLLDDNDAGGIVINGTWRKEERTNMINGEYRSANNNSVSNSITYTPNLPYTGRYRVSMSYFSEWDGRQDVPVTVHAGNGTFQYFVNMNAPPENGIWHELGEYDFSQGNSGYVTIGTNATGGRQTFADAVRFEILSIPNGTTITIPAQAGQGGAVCVTTHVPQCPSDYTICTTTVNVQGTLDIPEFVAQHTSVCEGFSFVYRINDIGADSYTWMLPGGMNINGLTGVVTGLGREVTVNMVAGTGTPVEIGVFGMIGSCNVYSDTIFTDPISFDGAGCKLANPVFIAQPASICTSGAATYTIAVVQSAEDYVWTLPSGLRQVSTLATGTVVTTAPFITVEPVNPQAATLGYITVYARSATIENSNPTATATVITVIAPAAFTLTANNITQCGINNGSIAISGLSASTSYAISYQSGSGSVGPINRISDTQGGIILSNMTAGSYSNFVVDLNGCATTDASSVTINDVVLPAITNVVYYSPHTCGDVGRITITFSDVPDGEVWMTDINGDGDFEYQGTTSHDTMTIAPVAPGTVISSLDLANNTTFCRISSSLTGAINNPFSFTFSFNLPQKYCMDNEVVLEGGTPEGGIYYVNGTPSSVINTSQLGLGSHVVIYEYIYNTCKFIASDTLFVRELPVAEITGPATICSTSAEIVYEVVDFSPQYRYLWEATNGNAIVSTDSSDIRVTWRTSAQGTVSLFVTDRLSGCSDTATLQVILGDHEQPEIQQCMQEYHVEAIEENGQSIIEMQPGDNICVPLAVDNCSGNLTYSFSYNGGTPVYSNDLTGQTFVDNGRNTLQWIVADAAGNADTCTTTIDFNIAHITPSAFSPDGIPPNDTWEIDFLDAFPECVVSVYNRWGMLVYRSEKGYPVPWDGKSKGNLVPVDTYFYVIDLGNGSRPYKGYVSVMY